MSIRTLIIALLAAVALSGCGRRGALEPPPGSGQVVESGAALGEGVSPIDPGSTMVVEEPEIDQTAPQRRFFLDFLL